MSPGDYEVRYRGSNQYNKFASLIVTKTIEAGLPREEKPSVAIDYETEEVTGFDSNSKYEFRYNREIHTVENQTTFSIPETMFGKVWNVFKLGDGSTTQNSEAQSLSIKARRHLPEDSVTPVDESAKGENDGQLKNVGFDREYRKVGELTWNKGTGNGTIDKLAPGDYEIRYRANKNAETFASLPITKTIKAGLPREATPSVAIDYETEEITGFDSNSKYKLSFNQEIYTVENQTTFSIPEAMFGKGWNVVKLGNGSTTQNSVAQSQGIKARRYLPGNSVTPVDESAKGENDGQLKNVGLDREYRKVGELSWTTGARNGTIENLAPGDYEIRYRANKNAETFASLPITKTIKAGLPREALPMIKIDFEQEKLTGFLATAKYELSFGTTIIKVENQTELSITDTMMNGQTWQIIQKAQDSTKLDSKPQSLIIPERPSLLADDIETVNESTAGKNDGQLLGVLPTLEYRLAGNSDWLTGATDGVIRNLRPGNYDIRQRASNQQQSFAGIILTKTIKQGEQVPEQTVTFESNGGSSIDPQKVKKGESIKEPKAPTRKGYIFSGWYADKKLQQRWNFTTAITENVTLYAKWEQESDDTGSTSTTDTSGTSSSKGEETKQSSNGIGSPAGSSTKPAASQNGAQKQTTKQYPKANDTSSAIHWLGIGLVLLGFAGLLLRRKKVEE